MGTARRLGPSVITTSSLTKVYGVPGLRAGWVLADAERIAAMTRVQDLLHVNDPAPLDPLVSLVALAYALIAVVGGSVAAGEWAKRDKGKEGGSEAEAAATT